MSLLAWIVLGLVAGFIASKVINRTGEGAILDIVSSRSLGQLRGACQAKPRPHIPHRRGSTPARQPQVWRTRQCLSDHPHFGPDLGP